MLFLRLPVRDLGAARTFYEALGFRVEQHSSSESEAAVVVDENIVLTLLSRDRFADLVTGPVADPGQGPTVLPCLTVAGRPDVDDLVARASAAGGRPGLPARGDDATYTGSFADPDGHAWQVMWMDQQHVVN